MQNVVVNIVREHLLTNLNLWADPALWDPKSVRLEAHSESWGDKNSGHVRRHFSSQSSQPPSLKCPLGIFNSLWAVLRGFLGPKKAGIIFWGAVCKYRLLWDDKATGKDRQCDFFTRPHHGLWLPLSDSITSSDIVLSVHFYSNILVSCGYCNKLLQTGYLKQGEIYS